LRREQLTAQASILFGSYAFAITLSSFIHEVGHILAMRYYGITSIRLVINPLTESYAMPLVSLPSEHMLLFSSSGMIFQFMVTTLIAGLLWRRRNILALPLLTCFPLSLLNIGSYLLMGGIVDGSDVLLMADAGLPLSVIRIVGIITLLVGVYAFTRILAGMCMGADSSMLEIALPIVSSFSLYGLAMLIYGYYSGYGTMIGSINLVMAPILTAVLTLVFKKTGPNEDAAVSYPGSEFRILGLGLVSVLFCLLYF